MLWLALLLILPSSVYAAHPFDHLAADLAKDPTLADVSSFVDLDLRYATEHNFMHENVYGPFKSCFLHVRAADSFKRVLAELKRQKPSWKLRAFDCLRPVRAQRKLWDVVKGTPNEKYVANPAFGSLHSYGFALDISLSDEQGREVDMGTPHDFFGPLAEPQHEAELLRTGELTRRQYQNRLFLRSLMGAGGFHVISTEWWHFDALPGAEVRAKYKQIQ